VRTKQLDEYLAACALFESSATWKVWHVWVQSLLHLLSGCHVAAEAVLMMLIGPLQLIPLLATAYRNFYVYVNVLRDYNRILYLAVVYLLCLMHVAPTTLPQQMQLTKLTWQQ